MLRNRAFLDLCRYQCTVGRGEGWGERIPLRLAKLSSPLPSQRKT